MTTTVATITVAPRFRVQIASARRSVRSSPDLGQIARRQVQSSYSRNSLRQERRSWRVVWEPLTVVEKDAIVSAYDLACGSGLAVLLTPPGEAGNIPVVFVASSLSTSNVAGKLWSVTAEYEEVI